MRVRVLLTMLVIGLAAALFGAGTAAAAVTTFGANLNRVPDNAETCVGPNIQLIVQSPSCTVESTNLATGESGFPPIGEGIVRDVRVRVGPRTGPMQIVLEEALRQDNPFEIGRPNYACCTLADASPVFTPRANAITTVRVDFRVLQSIVPDENGLYVDQHLALSVLDPTVPIPASLSSNGFVGAWYPAWSTVGEQKIGPAGTFVRADLLINADWDPAPGTGGNSPLRLPRVIRPVRSDVAFIPLVCQFNRACVGRLLLQSRQNGPQAAARPNARAGASAKKKIKTYAVVKFRVPIGKRKTVPAKLRKLGKRLLKERKKARVWVNVRMNGAPIGSSKLTLKRR
ncbi:MAG: hypothetical protein R2725_04600 [Solirubrobacterales bacterium]